MINKVDPILRLQLATLYMNYWVDAWPLSVPTFEVWMHQRHSHVIPGTIEWCKKRATNCYYCNSPFTLNVAFQMTVDHFVPKSLGKTDKYVICCYDCNQRKSNQTVEHLLSHIVRASLRGKSFWGYSGRRLNFIKGQMEKIVNDILHNTGPRVYYFKH